MGAVSVDSASTSACSDSPTSPMMAPQPSPAAAVVTVSRTGREKQRYQTDGERLVAGCIPVRPTKDGAGVEVLMVSNKHGDGMIFPKGGWETDETSEEAAARESMEEAGVRGDLEFLGEFCFSSKKKGKEGKKGPQASCIAQVYVMHVTEEMEVWPEHTTRHRSWCHPREAVAKCKHEWMRDALRRWGGKFHPELDLM